ncbi:MAG: hypothetical protein K2H95_01110 [Bacteroidales bacterium]|nr:hypothetical protein [Bacteroidales bacterium]MDE6147244.1 hypothetical protein [Bacteroidales bacterium]
MNKSKIKDILVRYTVATAGLLLVSAGVALSIKSDLGTSPISCPPYVVSLIGGLTVGQYTIVMHFMFILLQIALLRKRFRLENLMQIAAAFVFGFLTDAAIWAFSWLTLPSYLGKASVMLLSCALTAAGISIEVRAKAWMLAGEMTVAAISDVSGFRFRNVKIVFDSALVIISAVISLIAFGSVLGKGDTVVIREGTLVTALLTGYLMKFFDPVTERIFGKILDRAGSSSSL